MSTQQLRAAQPAKERRTAGWVAFIACTALIFDGYDLTIYGTVMPTLLNDSSHLGAFDAATAGALGSYAMLGVLVGAIICGAVGDYLGRRNIILFSLAWFSLGMVATALSTSVLLRSPAVPHRRRLGRDPGRGRHHDGGIRATG